MEMENVTLNDENFYEFTKLTLQGAIDKIFRMKVPLVDIKDIFHYQNKPCPRLLLILGGPGEYNIVKSSDADCMYHRYRQNNSYQ